MIFRVRKKRPRRKLKKSVKFVYIALLLLILSFIISFIKGNINSGEEEIDYGNIKGIDASEIDLGDITADETSEKPGPELTFKVIDVGQSQAVFIDIGETEVLIDGGNTDKGKLVSETISPYVDGDLDYVIATHSHKEHIGGLPQIYKDYQVGETIYGDKSDSKAYRKFEKAAENEPGSTYINDKDMTLQLGDNVSLTIFDVMDNDKNSDNNSIITLLQYNQVYFYSSGDAEKEAEIRLKGNLPQCDVVVASHHGFSNANTLLDELSPRYFVVSGKKGKSPNLPYKETLERAAALGSETYGTWKSGTITFTTNGITVVKAQTR